MFRSGRGPRLKSCRSLTGEEPDVAKFMDIHNGFIGVTELQLREAVGRDLAVEAADGVHFEHAWLDAESGTVFCLSSGPSKEAVRRVHDRAGHPAQEIYELSVEVEEPPLVVRPNLTGVAVSWPETREQTA
jgi:hypothetical protein